MKSKLIAAVFLFAIAITSGYAQNRKGSGQGMGGSISGTVKGKIMDKVQNIPVEYASVAFYKVRDSSLVTGGITNENGEFAIEKVPGGRYYSEIKFIGYKTLRLEPFAVNPRNMEVSLGTILLEPASEEIEGVVITGQKKMLTHNLDKKVFNVEKNINTEGGSALEIMESIPSVEVDMDGNVSLRGSQNVTILVDNKPSTYSSIDEIPADIIESIEVITNPSARYDPDGLSGIINIVFKKKRDPGYHAMVMLNAGTGDKYNGSLNVNYRQDKINVFTNLSYRQNRMTGQTLSDRTTTLSTGGESTLFQNQDFRRQGRLLSLRGGLDYFINSSNTLTLSGGYNSRERNMWDLTLNEIASPMQTSQYQREHVGGKDGNSYNLALNYKLDGKQKGQELTADMFFSSMKDLSYNDMTQWWDENLSTSLYEQTETDFNGNVLSAQTDLVQPIGNGGRLETGLKAMSRSQDNDYIFRNKVDEIWTPDILRNNNFVYSEQQFSAYAIYSNTFADGKFSYQGGVRAEQSFTNANQKATSDAPIERKFFNVFPSAHIKWDINSKHSAQMAYSKRISRPHTRFLNPFINYTDPLNLSMGNPYLNPELTNSFEISYYFNLPKTKINATIYQRYTTNIATRIVEVDDDGVAWSTYQNIDKSNSLGIEGVVSQTITPWWRVNANFNYNQIKLTSSFLDEKSSEGDSWSLRGTSSWNIGKHVEVQATGNYRSPSVSVGGSMKFWQSGGGQGTTQEMYWFDLGVRIKVLKNKGSINLRVRDILGTMSFKSNTWGNNFNSNIERTRESQIIFVGFSYKINEYKMRRDKEGAEALDMDID